MIVFWCPCHSEHDSGCRQCLDDRKREPVRDILNQTSSGNCRLSFPCFMDRHSVSTLRWLFPSSPDKWRSPSWLLTPCHSFLPCGSSGSRPAQAINHGDKSAQRLLFSVHTSCHPIACEMKERLDNMSHRSRNVTWSWEQKVSVSMCLYPLSKSPIFFKCRNWSDPLPRGYLQLV